MGPIGHRIRHRGTTPTLSTATRGRGKRAPGGTSAGCPAGRRDAHGPTVASRLPRRLLPPAFAQSYGGASAMTGASKGREAPLQTMLCLCRWCRRRASLTRTGRAVRGPGRRSDPVTGPCRRRNCRPRTGPVRGDGTAPTVDSVGDPQWRPMADVRRSGDIPDGGLTQITVVLSSVRLSAALRQPPAFLAGIPPGPSLEVER